jgi:hypothetical protein
MSFRQKSIRTALSTSMLPSLIREKFAMQVKRNKGTFLELTGRSRGCCSG